MSGKVGVERERNTESDLRDGVSEKTLGRKTHNQKGERREMVSQ